jgi:hypothetical protein
MHLCAGNAREHLERPGEIELRDVWKQNEPDLDGRGHGNLLT